MFLLRFCAFYLPPSSFNSFLHMLFSPSCILCSPSSLSAPFFSPLHLSVSFLALVPCISPKSFIVHLHIFFPPSCFFISPHGTICTSYSSPKLYFPPLRWCLSFSSRNPLFYPSLLSPSWKFMSPISLIYTLLYFAVTLHSPPSLFSPDDSHLHDARPPHNRYEGRRDAWTAYQLCTLFFYFDFIQQT